MSNKTKEIERLQKKIEFYRRWVERIKMVKAIFIAIIGIKLLPQVNDPSGVLVSLPILTYVFIEEARVQFESGIRNIANKIKSLELELKAKNRQERKYIGRKVVRTKRY